MCLPAVPHISRLSRVISRMETPIESPRHSARSAMHLAGGEVPWRYAGENTFVRKSTVKRVWGSTERAPCNKKK